MSAERVLMLVRRTVVLEDAAALLRALLRDGRFDPVVICPVPALAGQLAAAVDAPMTFVDYQGNAVQPSAVRSSEPAAAQPTRTRQQLRQSYLLRFLVALSRLLVGKVRMAGLFRRYPARMVIVFEDRAPYPEMVFLDQARRRGARAMLVSFAASSVESDVASRRNRPEHLVDEAPWRWLKRRLAARHPQEVRPTSYGRMLFFSAPETLALSCAGLLGGRSWHFGGGAVERCTKISLDDVELARREGAAAEKLVLTGQPMMDGMYEARRAAADRRSALIGKYSLDGTRPLLLCAVPHAGEHALVDWQRHMEITRELLAVLGRCGAAVLLSLHPRSARATYEGLARDNGCRILEERLSAALPAADIFVASYSSTVRWALMMGIPTIMADFLGLRYEQFAGLRGSIVVQEAAALERELRHLVGDKDRRERMGSEAAAAAAARGEFDGKACARIIDEMDRMLADGR